VIPVDRFEAGLQRRACLSRKCEVAQEANVTTDEDQPPIAPLPAAIAAVLAAIGIVGMIFVFVSAEQVPDGNVGMRSADAAYRAGATITPTSPNSARPSSPVRSRSFPSSSIMADDEIRKDL
jgi:hypothetical protein